MKYVSIDIETTGLDPETCQILEFGAVIENGGPIESLPTFRRLLQYRQVTGTPYALALNVKLLNELSGAFPRESCYPSDLGIEFAQWLRNHNLNPFSIVAAGKNFAKFDLQFLLQLNGFSNHVQFHHRSLDPITLYTEPADEVPPSTETCLQRAGIDKAVSHHAVDDALDVIKLLRHKGLR